MAIKKKRKPVVDIEALEANFQYGIEYIYDTVTNCAEAGCDEICRCGQIEDFRIKKVDVRYIVRQIVSSKCNDFLSYCVDRLINTYHLDSSDCWEENISGGYYGEEVDSINSITGG